MREDQVQVGVSFLQNLTAQNAPWPELERFLLDKGLTPAEVEEARRRRGQSTGPVSRPDAPAAAAGAPTAHQPNTFQAPPTVYIPQPGAAQADSPWQSALSGATRLAMLLALLGGAGTAAVHLYRTLFEAGAADRGIGSRLDDGTKDTHLAGEASGAGGDAGEEADRQLAAPHSAWRAPPVAAPWATPNAVDGTASEDDVERLEAQLRCVRDEMGRMSTAVHRQSSSLEDVATDVRAVAREVRTAVEAAGDARRGAADRSDTTHETLLALIQQQQQELAELWREVRELRACSGPAPAPRGSPTGESSMEVDGSPPPPPVAPHPTPARGEGAAAAGERTPASAADTRRTGGAVEAPPSVQGVGPSSSLARRRTEDFRAAMRDLEAKNSREVVTTAARSLLMYVAKLRDNPGTPRYRRVPRGNKQYRSSLEPAGGHQAVLTALGFVNSGRAFEHTWKEEDAECNAAVLGYAAEALGAVAEGKALPPPPPALTSSSAPAPSPAVRAPRAGPLNGVNGVHGRGGDQPFVGAEAARSAAQWSPTSNGAGLQAAKDAFAASQATPPPSGAVRAEGGGEGAKWVRDREDAPPFPLTPVAGPQSLQEVTQMVAEGKELPGIQQVRGGVSTSAGPLLAEAMAGGAPPRKPWERDAGEGR